MRNRFETTHVVLNTLGAVFIALSWVLLIPVVVILLFGEISAHDYSTLAAFVYPAILSLILGIVLKKAFRGGAPSAVQAMLACAIGWIGCSAIGAIPFVVAIDASYLDAYFETMSGFTTTGITMFSGLDSMPKSILFWRSLTQWVGGLGILTFFLAVTYRGGGAHRLFGAESHKIGMPRPVPGLGHTLKILWTIYGAYTLVIALGLFLAGMGAFDSICHSFTALSTGGFSPHDASIGYYKLAGYPNYILFEYIIIIGMLLGGINFLIHYRLAGRGPKALFETTEMKYFWSIIVVFAFIIFIERLIRIDPATGFADSYGGVLADVERNLRAVIFQVVSILTTTGFGTRDIGGKFFGVAARQLFLILMVIGGCTGSTSGGLKVLRVAVLIRLVEREIYRVVRPRRALNKIIIDGEVIPDSEIRRVAALFFSWILLLCLGGFVTAMLSQHDAISSFSGMFSALGNIGPAYISVSEMAALNPIIKVTYILGMLAGRLEILPVLLLFSRGAWLSW